MFEMPGRDGPFIVESVKGISVQIVGGATRKGGEWVLKSVCFGVGETGENFTTEIVELDRKFFPVFYNEREAMFTEIKDGVETEPFEVDEILDYVYEKYRAEILKRAPAGGLNWIVEGHSINGHVMLESYNNPGNVWIEDVAESKESIKQHLLQLPGSGYPRQDEYQSYYFLKEKKDKDPDILIMNVAVAMFFAREEKPELREFIISPWPSEEEKKFALGAKVGSRFKKPKA